MSGRLREGKRKIGIVRETERKKERERERGGERILPQITLH